MTAYVRKKGKKHGKSVKLFIETVKLFIEFRKKTWYNNDMKDNR